MCLDQETTGSWTCVCGRLLDLLRVFLILQRAHIQANVHLDQPKCIATQTPRKNGVLSAMGLGSYIKYNTMASHCMICKHGECNRIQFVNDLYATLCSRCLHDIASSAVSRLKDHCWPIIRWLYSEGIPQELIFLLCGASASVVNMHWLAIDPIEI